MNDTQSSEKAITDPEIYTSWERGAIFRAPVIPQDAQKKKYILDMFPYPSAQGLHVGHPEGYTATDILARYFRMKRYEVLHPMGWDAFGLPAENYAIKTGVHPDKSTHANIDNFRTQIQSLGFSYDWDREIDTSDPQYYRWTQWIFLQMYKHGLAYRKKAKVNWCNTCQTVLANEQVENGLCERSKDPVIQKDLEQWFFKITEYAEELLSGLDTIDWPESIKLMQRNWIGKSEGTLVDFVVKGSLETTVTIFTTRVDTIFSAAFIVLAPEHPLVEAITTPEQKEAVQAYQQQSRLKNDLERTDLSKEKTGAFTGAYAINPVSGKEIPVWVGDFVLSTYGTGAIFGDAHDERDMAMAKTYSIPLTLSVRPADEESWQKVQRYEECFTDDGILVNSGEFDGLTSAQAREAITTWLEQKGLGKKKINYRLRDWLISRQRYWGAPIPIVYDPEGNAHPVEEKHLPLKLPVDVDYRPKGTSPLGSSESYTALAAKEYGAGWRFEIDTMDTFVCSSWYYLRYCDPRNSERFADPDKLAAWLPVDMYVGGAEHAVLHLLYARFFHKALQDFGYIPQSVGREPFAALRNQGMILGEDHQKMSKSRGNVVNPDDIVKVYGADTLRMYEMFMGPFDEVKPWDPSSIKGMKRFLDRVERFVKEAAGCDDVDTSSTAIHGLIKKVSQDIERFHFNTAISELMIYFNDQRDTFGSKVKENGQLSRSRVDHAALRSFLILLSVFAPFTVERLWHDVLGEKEMIAKQPWPTYDPKHAERATVTVAIQIHGKTRATCVVPKDLESARVQARALELPEIQKWIAGKEIAKVIVVPNKIVNIILT